MFTIYKATKLTNDENISFSKTIEHIITDMDLTYVLNIDDHISGYIIYLHYKKIGNFYDLKSMYESDEKLLHNLILELGYYTKIEEKAVHPVIIYCEEIRNKRVNLN